MARATTAAATPAFASANSAAGSATTTEPSAGSDACHGQRFCSLLHLMCCDTALGCCQPDASGAMLSCCVGVTNTSTTTTSLPITTTPTTTTPSVVRGTANATTLPTNKTIAPTTVTVLNTTAPVVTIAPIDTKAPITQEVTTVVATGTPFVRSDPAQIAQTRQRDQEPPLYEKAWFISAIIVGMFILGSIIHFYCCRNKKHHNKGLDSPGTPEIESGGIPAVRRYARHKTMFQSACEYQPMRPEKWWQANLTTAPKALGSHPSSMIVLTPPVSQTSGQKPQPVQEDLMFNYSMMSSTSSWNGQRGCGAVLSNSSIRSTYEL